MMLFRGSIGSTKFCKFVQPPWTRMTLPRCPKLNVSNTSFNFCRNTMAVYDWVWESKTSKISGKLQTTKLIYWISLGKRNIRRIKITVRSCTKDCHLSLLKICFLKYSFWDSPWTIFTSCQARSTIQLTSCSWLSIMKVGISKWMTN